MINMLNVKGKLEPARLEEVTDETVYQICSAFGREGLWWAMHEEQGEDGVIEIQSGISRESQEPDRFCLRLAPDEQTRCWEAALNFLSDITSVLEAEGVQELGLRGHLIITVDSDEDPLVVRANVSNGKVSYQKAQLVWDEPEDMHS